VNSGSDAGNIDILLRRSFARAPLKTNMRIFLFAAIWASSALAAQTVRVSPTPPGGDNTHYAANREPLLPNPLIKLPLTSVRPQGWLRHQLELMSRGFSGRLTEISQFCKYEGNEWTSGQGKFGWEEVPYWLRGYIDLGYLLEDPEIIRETNRWVNAVLATQQPSGYFGSRSNLESTRTRGVRARMVDLWPNMVMLFALRSLHEATGDPRIVPFMTRYFRWQTTVPFEDFLPASVQKVRGGDNLDSIYWLYNRTGERWLLDLARINHERTADWFGGVASWHNVNFAEGFREPAQFYQQTRDKRYLEATERNYRTMRGLYGQVPGGMYGADENARPGYNGPRQGTELCGFIEMMFSDEILAGITGDVAWADRAEDVAFNSFPPSMTPDLKGLHYLTAPNQVQLDRANKAPAVQNRGDMFSYNPWQYRCCQHNASFGWPYFTEHAWMATRGNGLAAVFYAPTEVKAKVGGGAQVRIVEATSYPFDETFNLTFAASKPVAFPLALRIPGWCERPALSVNGKPLAVPSAAKGWLIVERTWSDGDKLRLELPMRVTVQVWRENGNTVSVSRGPLTYSLKIGERWQRYGGTDDWPAHEVYPSTPWNYGLIVDVKNPAVSFKVLRGKKPLPPQPFTLDGSTVTLRAKGKRIPAWQQEPSGMIGEVQPGPLRSDEPVEELTLIPMGCARLRISAFPQVVEKPPVSQDERMAWWREARFGMFIHWGLYAVLGGEWNGLDYGKEMGGASAEHIFFRSPIPREEYKSMAGRFNPVKFNAAEWVRIARDAGMKYMVITSKHHDGFSMYGTKMTRYNIVDATPFKRDVVGELAAECRRQGIRFGIYYSHSVDWENRKRAWRNLPPPPPEYVRLVKGQLTELLTQYGRMSLLWFDTGDQYQDVNSEYGELVKRLSPETIVSGRLGGHANIADYRSEGDRRIPPARVTGDAETPMTMRDNWGYDRDEDNWKSVQDLIERLSLTVCRGANMLLNVGPTPEGTYTPEEVERLSGIGQWMKVNGEAIYGTSAGPFDFDFDWGSISQKPGRLYLHVLKWNPTGIAFPGLKTPVKRAYLLSDPKRAELKVAQDHEKGLTKVSVPSQAPGPYVNVIVLELNGELETDPAAKGRYVWVKGIDIRLNKEKIERQRKSGWDNKWSWDMSGVSQPDQR